jgi:outer membrane lipoprotein SlyB
MALRLEKITVGEESYSIKSNTLRFEAEGTGKRDAKRIGIASGAGAVIGAIAGGGRGAAIGAAIGAGAGTGVTVATPGDEVEFRTEQMFQFTLERGVEMKIR